MADGAGEGQVAIIEYREGEDGNEVPTLMLIKEAIVSEKIWAQRRVRLHQASKQSSPQSFSSKLFPPFHLSHFSIDCPCFGRHHQSLSQQCVAGLVEPLFCCFQFAFPFSKHFNTSWWSSVQHQIPVFRWISEIFIQHKNRCEVLFTILLIYWWFHSRWIGLSYLKTFIFMYFMQICNF